MVIVTWISRTDTSWCTLEEVGLSRVRTTGVFMVWYAGDPGRVVCVGQGDIAARLKELKEDKALSAYKAKGDLLVTWAEVSPARIDGIERYLAETWPPLIAGRTPEAASIEVNSPGWMRPFV
jgi:hypothetical protein